MGDAAVLLIERMRKKKFKPVEGCLLRFALGSHWSHAVLQNPLAQVNKQTTLEYLLREHLTTPGRS